ncbi:MAG TPA: 23S rRNA (pseudouridine(1915)-N(3))-methyltransferase RlmH [Prosthecobacter sp.]|nr:23S rRNA (pseudouridine(1915)-N(3))-methyltransferase RlmH [Prosthecobacter sp.]
MQWKIITVGKPTFIWARDAAQEYLGRLQRVVRVQHVMIKEGHREQVEAQIVNASANTLRVVLDERGKTLRSVDLAAWIQDQELNSRKCASLIIGGAEGHSPSLKKIADECWTLSAFTLQHEIALIVMAEQLYRAYTILKNEPYHRE